MSRMSLRTVSVRDRDPSSSIPSTVRDPNISQGERVSEHPGTSWSRRGDICTADELSSRCRKMDADEGRRERTRRDIDAHALPPPSHVRDQLLHAFVDGLERVLAQNGPLRLIVELQVHPVDRVVPSLRLRLPDEV